MIASNYEEVHSESWIQQNILIPTNELVLYRKIIPWNNIIKGLLRFYDSKKGPFGKNLRMMVGILFVMRFRNLSDRKVIEQIRENHYIQYFCNIPDDDLQTCVDHSTICRFRKRLGEKGVAHIENEIFKHLKRSNAIDNDMSLIDSTVLNSNVIHPNDVQLLFSALKKMVSWSHKYNVPLWFVHKDVKQLWHRFHKDKKANRLEYLQSFYELFTKAIEGFKNIFNQLELSPIAALEFDSLLSIFKILEDQTQMKLDEKTHIENRLVSLKELDARPIKKGKSFPKCEFGTTNQMCFNRQGFLITCDLFIGAPRDKVVYRSTLEKYIKRMKGNPNAVITDGNYRSTQNLKIHSEEIKSIFMGQTSDVQEENLKDCLSARSATEGFIAIAKNLRGFGKSLYLGLRGDKIWAALNQAVYNLKKVLQLYQKEVYEESVLITLGLLDA